MASFLLVYWREISCEILRNARGETAVKFGAFVPQGWRMDLAAIDDPIEKYETMMAVAVEAERLGFDSVWLYVAFKHPARLPKESRHRPGHKELGQVRAYALRHWR